MFWGLNWQSMHAKIEQLKKRRSRSTSSLVVSIPEGRGERLIGGCCVPESSTG